MSNTAAGRDAVGPLKEFVGVVADGQTYRNLLYLLVAIPLGVVYYFGLVSGFMLGVVLVVVLIGLPILFVTIVGSRFFARLERRLANSLLGTEIEPPADLPSVTDDGVLAALTGLVRAESTWKGVAFLLVKSFIAFLVSLFVLIAGFVSLALTLAPVARPVEIMEVWTIDTLGEGLLALPLGVLLALASLHVLNAAARITGTIAVSLLDGHADGSEPEQ